MIQSCNDERNLKNLQRKEDLFVVWRFNQNLFIISIVVTIESITMLTLTKYDGLEFRFNLVLDDAPEKYGKPNESLRNYSR